MKYAVIITDGLADDPIEELGQKSPVEYAQTPAMDAIAAQGQLGLVNTIPDGCPPGSAVACMSIFGYDPAVNFSGRGPLEAGGMNLEVDEDEFAFRVNVVNLDAEAGIMIDYSAGHISSDEGRQIVADLADEFNKPGVYSFHPGVSYRHLFKVKKDVLKSIPTCTPPHDITEQPFGPHIPQGEGADMLIDLMEKTRAFLAAHPINTARVEAGKRPANSLWFWSGGVKPAFKTYDERFGIKGAAISAVDLVQGIAFFAGMPSLDVPGITGYYDTNYQGKADYAIEALAEKDFMLIHVESPDEASHNGHMDEKIKAIETIDKIIIGPVHEALKAQGDYRIAVMPDHYTPLSTRTHRAGAVPAALCGTGIEADDSTAFSEKQAAEGSFNLDKGYTFINKLTGLEG